MQGFLRSLEVVEGLGVFGFPQAGALTHPYKQ